MTQFLNYETDSKNFRIMVKKYISSLFRLTLAAMLAVSVSAVLTSCKDEEMVGDPYFFVEGAEDGVVHMGVKGLQQSEWAFGNGTHMVVRANGSWQLIPQEEEDLDWLKVYPLEGVNDGILRFNVEDNPMAEVRNANFRIILNGVEQPQLLTLAQDPTGPTLNITADNIMLKQAGGSSDVVVTANYDWVFEVDAAATWLSVTRENDKLTIGTEEANKSGAERSATITISGTGSTSDLKTVINVTQLDAIFFDDFSWAFCPTDKNADFCDEPIVEAFCWGSNNMYIDVWNDPVKSANPGWSGIHSELNGSWSAASVAARYHFLLFGTKDAKAGNLCSPYIPEIEGEITATVSWNMAGFTDKNNNKEQGNEFWVALLGPGKIKEAHAYGTSTASIMTGMVTIPYDKSGNTLGKKKATYDIDLTETARFYIGKDGYFDKEESTCLEVWKNRESKFEIVVEGMTNETRVVFIGCDADRLTMHNGYNVKSLQSRYKSNRKLFDNFKVVEN